MKSDYAIVNLSCATCGRKACGELGTAKGAGWAVGPSMTLCPECAKKEKRL
jgi:hypothetical protein